MQEPLFILDHLYEINFGVNWVVVIWGYCVGIHLADKNLFPFIIFFFSFYLGMSIIKAWRVPYTFLSSLYLLSCHIHGMTPKQ